MTVKIDNETPKHRKKAKKTRKKFFIEYRGREDAFDPLKFFRNWKVYSRYETKERRDEAYETLSKKGARFFEFRKGEG